MITPINKDSRIIRSRNGFLAFLKSIYGDPTKDERLRFIKYRAGYYGSRVTCLLMMAALLVNESLSVEERFNYRTLMLIVVFAGIFTETIFLWRHQYTEAVYEVWARNAAGLRRARIVGVYSVVVMSAITFAQLKLFPEWISYGKLGDILYSLFFGLLFGAMMWLEISRRRKKAVDPAMNSDWSVTTKKQD